ncbi:hypothetical protein MoryE10_12370 [Methylogaea oryzae]|uniref:Regulatory protein RecX n=1 Tax=Methylogaea oryzae TaxID=1295382 RepID=A0A8D5AHU3_9GAMM|nr:regulatory protein RecX [Methylogaea oryzae]BBL70631.1 hypothetical protein MoryE10_12370 [Methylogaea oryzae]
MRLLARREYSAAELRAKLAGRGCGQEAAEAALEALRRDGWQSDSRYAESMTRGRALRGYGPLSVRQRLRQAGIDDAAALTEADIDWRAALAAAYKKKYGDTTPDSREEYARRGRFLQGRGFAVEQIRDFLDRLKKHKNEG